MPVIGSLPTEGASAQLAYCQTEHREGGGGSSLARGATAKFAAGGGRTRTLPRGRNLASEWRNLAVAESRVSLDHDAAASENTSSRISLPFTIVQSRMPAHGARPECRAAAGVRAGHGKPMPSREQARQLSKMVVPAGPVLGRCCRAGASPPQCPQCPGL